MKRMSILGLFTIVLLFGFTSLGSAEMQVSLNNVNVDLPKIEVDIHLAGGEDVSGYVILIVYDRAVLKYVDTTEGDYLPTGGIFMRPVLSGEDTYDLKLTIDETTTAGQSVVLGEGAEAQTFLLSGLFNKKLPPEDFFQGKGTPYMVSPEPTHWYWGLYLFRLAPDTATGDGTLATVSFEVIDPDKPIDIHLYHGELYGAEGIPLHATFVNQSVYFQELLSDVNADGVVNILDLTGVAAAFGDVVAEANRSADVNADGEINILDLVQIANDFGKEVLSFVTQTIREFVDMDTSVEDHKPPMPEPIDVGLVLPLSGHLAEIGEMMETGFDLAANELGDTIRMRYIVADDQGTAEGAVAAFENLIHEHGVSVILGPGSSSSARAAFPIAQENEVVAMSATAGSKRTGSDR